MAESFQSIILIVDGAEESSQVIKKVLESASHRIIYCISGQEAIRLAQEDQLDLIFLKVKLPDLSGLSGPKLQAGIG